MDFGANDCEAIHAGWLAQPVNAWSSLAYLAAGLWLVRRVGPVESDRKALAGIYAMAVAANGVGSWFFHGPGTAAAGWLHDLAIAAVLVVIVAVALVDLGRMSPAQAVRGTALATVVVGLALAVAEGLGLVVITLALPAAGAVVLTVRRGIWAASTTSLIGGAGLLAVVVLAAAAGRTGGVLCRPDSLMQGHAVFHLATASLLVGWGVWVFPSRGPTEML